LWVNTAFHNRTIVSDEKRIVKGSQQGYNISIRITKTKTNMPTHHELGFESEMPGATGASVEVVTPRQEQLRELQERATQHFETAGNIGIALSEVEGRLEDIVNEFVTAANEEAVRKPSEETFEEAVIADEVGMSEIIESGQDSIGIAMVLIQQPEGPLEQAFKEAESIVDDVNIDKVTEAIKRVGESEHQSSAVKELTHEDVQVLMDTEDEHARMANGLSLLADELAGRSTMTMGAIRILFDRMPFIDLESLITSGSSEVAHLAERIAQVPSRKFDSGNPCYTELHAKNLRLIEHQMGAGAITWREKLRKGEELVPAANLYVERGQIGSMLLYDAGETLERGLRQDTSDKSKIDNNKMYAQSVGAVLEYTLDYAGSGSQDFDVRASMSGSMLQGDLLQYGLTKTKLDNGEDGWFINEKGIGALRRYVENIEQLGIENAQRIHERFGIVNFGRYEPQLLVSMNEMLEHPHIGRDLSVIVLGKTGDHNAAFMEMMKNRPLKNTVVFEVETTDDVAEVARALDRLGGIYQRLTLAGHGGEDGLFLSQSLSVGGYDSNLRTMADNPINNIIERLAPNQDGNRDLVLYSCSQGKRYRGKNSTAETISEIQLDRVKIEAAYDVMTPGSTGKIDETVFYNRPLHSLATRIAEKYPKSEDRINKLFRQFQGKVVIEGGKRMKTKNGIVRIGA